MNVEAIMTEFEAAVTQQVALAGDDPAVRAAAEAILTALGPAGRQLALGIAEQAAVEVGAQLPDYEIEVVLSDGEPSLRVQPVEGRGSAFRLDDLEARLTLRLPEALKKAVEDAAAGSGESINAYVVKTLGSKAGRQSHSPGRRVQGTIQT